MIFDTIHALHSLPWLETGVLDSKRIACAKCFTVKNTDYIAAVLDDAPVVVLGTDKTKKTFALSGIPIKISDLLILIPSNYRYITTS